MGIWNTCQGLFLRNEHWSLRDLSVGLLRQQVLLVAEQMCPGESRKLGEPVADKRNPTGASSTHELVSGSALS
jgi:hypothetical protein